MLFETALTTMASPPHSANLTMPCFDELFDDAFSSFRIPPLRSMFPSSTTDRNEAFDSFTGLQQDDPRAGLTGRQMALAQAKPMEMSKSSELEALEPAVAPAPDARLEHHALDAHNKKRRKLAHEEKVLDFVTLPKPLPKPKFEEESKKPFRPIATLNQLNEPPPSAALFPPITPNRELQDIRETNDAWSKDSEALAENEDQLSKGTPMKLKRLRLRPRQMWTPEETSDLLEGVAIMGVGRWKDILTHPKFHFQESRTYVDLKDRFRVLFPQAQPEKWGDVGNQADYDLNLRFKRNKRTKALSGKKVPYRSWTEAEDAELHKGFQKHGYKWQHIAEDQTLQLSSRSHTQIRDRFRRIHPELYTDVPPQQPRQTQSKRGRGRGRPPGKQKQPGHCDAASQSTDTEQCRDVDGTDEDPAATTGGLVTPAFLSGLLNSNNKEPEGPFSRSLADLGGHVDDGEDDDLRLAPVQWDEMSVQPIFDLV